MDTGLKGIQSKFANDTTLGGAVDSLEDRGPAKTPGQITGLGNHQMHEILTKTSARFCIQGGETLDLQTNWVTRV